MRCLIVKNQGAFVAQELGTQEEIDAVILEKYQDEGLTLDQYDLETYQQLQQESNDALRYLSSTDWVVVRFTETGLAIPAEISAARAAARLKVL